MKVSNNALNLIKKWEGFKDTAYLCPAKVWTIGYGTTKYSNGQSVKKGDKITQVEALKLLEKQVNEHASTIYQYITVELNQNQFDALASFQYNLGKYILKGSTLLSYLNNKQWNKASDEMGLYVKAGGKVLQGLVNRRKEERELFMKVIEKEQRVKKEGENMAYTYKQMHVSKSKHSIKCPYNMKPEYITIHNTANSASASSEARYHNSNNNQVSYHIAIDDKDAIEVVPLNKIAWHCGDGKGNGNMKSIGIEICYSKNGGEQYIKAEENAVHLTAKLLHERKWNIDRVKKHQDWSGKVCPHRILSEGRWQSFLNRIQKELDKLNGKGGSLSMSEYQELKSLIQSQNAKIKELENKLSNKMDILSEREVGKSHKEAWVWAEKEGLLNGKSPQDYVSREQIGTVLKRLFDKLSK